MKIQEEVLWKNGLLPSLDLYTSENMEHIIRAVNKAGLNVFELSITNESFETTSALVKSKKGNALVISGIRNIADCHKAYEYGADVIVSYSLRQELAQWCAQHELLYVPGCTTASEVERALDMELCTLMYTPCFEPAACSELYDIWKDRGLKFLVTGGIDQGNYLDFADKPYIIAVGGKFICPKTVAETNDFEQIRRFVEHIYLKNLGFELGHVGINTASDEEGHKLTDKISETFGVSSEHGHVGNWSLLRGIEVVNGKGPGSCGHIAVQCNNVVRAIYYLENHGHKVKQESYRFRYPGRLSFAYLEEEFGGFAIHLMLRWTAP